MSALPQRPQTPAGGPDRSAPGTARRYSAGLRPGTSRPLDPDQPVTGGPGPAGRPQDAPTSGVVPAADRCQPVAL